MNKELYGEDRGRNMRILLVNPPTSDQPGFKKYAVFPYGVLFLAAVLEKAGYRVKIYDNNIDSRKPEDFVSFDPVLIGFSVLTGRSIGDAIDQSIKFKEILPKTKIVWGGIHPSLLPEQTIIEPYIDYVTVGEGEYTLLELVQHLEKGEPKLYDIESLVYKKYNKIVKNEPRPFIKNLNELPDPAWHLVDVKKYSQITLNTSRGCPFRCAFCYNQTFNKGRRSEFTAERIVSWIEYFKRNYGTTSFKFYEDNFTMNRKRVRQFCNLLIDKKLGIEWNCESRADLTEDDISLMAKSGCNAIGMGVESGSPRMLKFLQKDIALEDVEKVCKLLVHYKIGPGIYVMAGLPTETIEELNMTIRLLDKLDFKWCEYMIYRPYPGTVLYDYCVSNKLFNPPKKLADWVSFSDLYDTGNALSDVPQELLDKNLDEFRKKYVLNNLKFMVKHDTFNLIFKLFNPYKLLSALKSYLELHRYLKAKKKQ